MPSKKWSNEEVAKHSNAMDLEQGVFTLDDPKRIALSLKNSSEKSTRRRASPFQSAMSMLNFYLNRAGKNLPKKRIIVLDKAKEELRILFGRNY